MNGINKKQKTAINAISCGDNVDDEDDVFVLFEILTPSVDTT